VSREKEKKPFGRVVTPEREKINNMGGMIILEVGLIKVLRITFWLGGKGRI